MINHNVCTTIYNGGRQQRICLKKANDCTVIYQRAMRRATRRHPRMSTVLIRKKVLTDLAKAGHAVKV